MVSSWEPGDVDLQGGDKGIGLGLGAGGMRSPGGLCPGRQT